MGNWKNSYHLLDGDDALIGLENETVVKTQRGLGFNSHHDDPHVVPEEGNDDSGTGPAPAEPAPVEAPSAPAEPAPSPAPSEPTPVNEGTNQTGSSGTTGETTPPSNSGNGSSYYDDYDDYDDYDSGYNNDDDDNYSGNGNSSGSSSSGSAGVSHPAEAGQSTESNQSAETGQTTNLNGNNMDNVNAPPVTVSPREKAKKALSNLSQWELDNLKATNKNDILAVYNDDKVTKKKLSFEELIKERGKNLPMQKDKDGNVVYPYACHYDSAIGAINLIGYEYKDGRTKEDVEKIASDAISEEGNRPYTDVIKEVFGVDAIYHEIPAGLSEKELKDLVGNNPAVVRFPQKAFWGNKFPTDQYHAIGYSGGGFIEPYMGRYGETWEDVRGRNSQSDFTSNLGGFYFEIKK